MIGDLAKGCIGIANRDLCDVCKMYELTQKLDKYKAIEDVQADQDIYKLAN